MEAYLFIEKQLQLLRKPVDLYFDATGSVVRPPACHEHFQQRVYYYAGVIRLKGEIHVYTTHQLLYHIFVSSENNFRLFTHQNKTKNIQLSYYRLVLAINKRDQSCF